MRNLAPVPSLAPGACLLAMLLGCGLRDGRASAHWTTARGAADLSAAATAGWCASSRTILVQATDADRVVGLTWRYDSLVPGTVPLTPPSSPDSTPLGSASAALRYVADGEVLGFRSASGMLRVNAVDTTMLDARLEAHLQRVGRSDTTLFTAAFRRVPLVRDTTLCHP